MQKSEFANAATGHGNANQATPAGRALWLVLFALFMTFSLGCGEPSSTVYIDNGGSATMIVRVDDQPAANLLPGEFTTLKLPAGEHKFHVRCGGQTLFDGSKTVDEPKGFGIPRDYVFNPDGRHRYAACKVLYGSQLFSDAAESALVKLAEHHANQKVDPTLLEFIRMKRFAEPMPAGDWFELPGDVFYVLRDAPEAVYSRTGSETRRVLTRVSPDDHASLCRCHETEQPNDNDLAVLSAATVNALDSMSNLESIQ